jgi:hypothetical protein
MSAGKVAGRPCFRRLSLAEAALSGYTFSLGCLGRITVHDQSLASFFRSLSGGSVFAAGLDRAGSAEEAERR